MNAELREQWCQALESGEYPQTQGQLRRLQPSDKYPTGYCCLGVLGKIVGELDEQGRWQGNLDRLPQHATVEFGLLEHEAKLIKLNDSCRMKFPSIAAWIRENIPAE